MKVSVVGVEGCGRTVFLGLFYETLVQMTTAKGNAGKGEIRFICEPGTVKCLGDIRLDLISRRWPLKERKQGITDCSMDIGFRKGRFFGLLPSNEFRTATIVAVEVGKRDVRVLEEMASPDGGHCDQSLKLMTRGMGKLRSLTEKHRTVTVVTNYGLAKLMYRKGLRPLFYDGVDRVIDPLYDR